MTRSTPEAIGPLTDRRRITEAHPVDAIDAWTAPATIQVLARVGQGLADLVVDERPVVAGAGRS